MLRRLHSTARRPQISRGSPPGGATFDLRPAGRERQTETLLLVFFEKEHEVLVGRLKGALDHEATTVAVNRHALSVGVGSHNGQLIVRVPAGWKHGQGLT